MKYKSSKTAPIEVEILVSRGSACKIETYSGRNVVIRTKFLLQKIKKIGLLNLLDLLEGFVCNP